MIELSTKLTARERMTRISRHGWGYDLPMPAEGLPVYIHPNEYQGLEHEHEEGYGLIIEVAECPSLFLPEGKTRKGIVVRYKEGRVGTPKAPSQFWLEDGVWHLQLL